MSHLLNTLTKETNQNDFVVNLTQHDFTNEQIQEIESKGYTIVNPTPDELRNIRQLITFDTLPSQSEMVKVAKFLATFVEEKCQCRKGNLATAMIGGAPFFQGVLEMALREKGIRPMYAFSKRVVVENTLPDGSVEKKAIFKHGGFIFPVGKLD